MAKRIAQAEIQKYWEIFSPLVNGGKYLTGSQAAPVLKNSRLRDDQLERIWDLADVDNDGNLDFEEFCVAMRIIFDLVNGEYAEVPSQLPDWLVPESKAHLIQAKTALSSGHHVSFHPSVDDDEDGPTLKDGFDWYMSPGDKRKYEAIYTAHKSPHGALAFDSLDSLYEDLDVPDSEVRFAWNLVNAASEPAIGKSAALAFLHLLNMRHEGYRMPRSVPASLRSTFEQGQIDYNVENARGVKSKAGYDDTTDSGRKAKFGDAYLTRLGLDSGSKNPSAPTNRGTDFSSVKTTDDWEETRLKRELQDLEAKIAKVEAMSKGTSDRSKRQDSSRPALIRRELEQLLDYKRQQLRDLQSGQGRSKTSQTLQGLEDEIGSIKEMVEGLERHLSERNHVLEGLRSEILEARA